MAGNNTHSEVREPQQGGEGRPHSRTDPQQAHAREETNMRGVDLTRPGAVPGVIVTDFGDLAIPEPIGRLMAQLTLWERNAIDAAHLAFLAGGDARDVQLPPVLPDLPALAPLTAVPVTP